MSGTVLPHLSLAYGFYPEATKKLIINGVTADICASFEAKALHLIRAESHEPKDWHQIAHFPIV